MALFDPKARTISLLQRAIEEKNASINRYFDEIGRLYYGQYRDVSVDVSKDINARCDAISTLFIDIEANKLKILFEKGLKLCSSCKRENPLEHAFCSACGTKFPEGSDKQVEVPTSLPPVPPTLVPKGTQAATDVAAHEVQAVPVQSEPIPVNGEAPANPPQNL